MDKNFWDALDRLDQNLEAPFLKDLNPKPFPPSQDLIEAIENIPRKDAREEAITIMNHGLAGIENNAKHLWIKSQRHKLCSPIILKEEFDGIATTMRELAGKLRTLSPTAKEYIRYIPDYDMASDECKYQIDLWDEFNASEAFPSPFLDDDTKPLLPARLEGMAKIMDSMAKEAEKISTKKPGLQEIFEPPPIDLMIFHLCARVLVRHGKTLKHLRPIAETIYQCVTKNAPSPYWAKRQEEEARKRYGTHPPEKG